MAKSNWVLCPICGNKTRLKIRKDTIIMNLPLFCPKCKNEVLVSIDHLKMTQLENARRIDAEPKK